MEVICIRVPQQLQAGLVDCTTRTFKYSPFVPVYSPQPRRWSVGPYNAAMYMGASTTMEAVL